MVFINSEGKFNENTHLIDGQLFKMKGNMAIYVIENKGIRMMIDSGEDLAARKVVKKLNSGTQLLNFDKQNYSYRLSLTQTLTL